MALSAAAAAVALGGCALLSGASDLTVGDVPAVGEAGVIDAPGSIDGAQADGPAPDTDAAVDAGSDAPSDASLEDGNVGRIKDITYENNSLTHPMTGADGVTGNPKLVGSADSLAGSYSMEATVDPSFVTENFVAVSELYATFLISVDPISSNGTVTIARILSGPNASSIEVAIGNGATRNLIATQGLSTIGMGGFIPSDDQVYRIGLHARQGAGNGVIEVFVATKTGMFVTAVVSSTTATVATMARLQVGVISGAGSKMTFDDIRVDSRSMPSPQ
jgi:hypothetical protein